MLCQILTLMSECCSRHRDFSYQACFSDLLLPNFKVVCANCSGSCSQTTPYLVWSSVSLCSSDSETIFCTAWLFGLLLSYQFKSVLPSNYMGDSFLFRYNKKLAKLIRSQCFSLITDKYPLCCCRVKLQVFFLHKITYADTFHELRTESSLSHRPLMRKVLIALMINGVQDNFPVTVEKAVCCRL